MTHCGLVVFALLSLVRFPSDGRPDEVKKRGDDKIGDNPHCPTFSIASRAWLLDLILLRTCTRSRERRFRLCSFSSSACAFRTGRLTSLVLFLLCLVFQEQPHNLTAARHGVSRRPSPCSSGPKPHSLQGAMEGMLGNSLLQLHFCFNEAASDLLPLQTRYILVGRRTAIINKQKERQFGQFGSSAKSNASEPKPLTKVYTDEYCISLFKSKVSALITLFLPLVEYTQFLTGACLYRMMWNPPISGPRAASSIVKSKCFPTASKGLSCLHLLLL